MAVVGESITLDAVAFDLLWERLALGAFPLVLQLHSHGDTVEERHALLDGARQRLREDGLLDGPDINPRLARWLQVLARPDDEVDVRWRDGTNQLRATVVRQGDTTVRVVCRGGELSFTPVTPGSMPSAAVDVLPDVPAASGDGQLSAPTEALSAAYTAAATSAQAGTAALLALGASRVNANALATALLSTEAVSQIGAATTVNGRRVRHPSVVAVLDTGHGRYVSTERAAPDHRLWSTVRPATTAQLVRAATELLADVRSESASSTGRALLL
jgi:hypothetical protein